MVKVLSAFQMVSRGWAFVIHHRREALRMALLPAVLWLLLALLGTAASSPLPMSGLLADCLVVMFAVAWFRFVLGLKSPAVRMPSPYGLLRVAARVAVVVPLAVLILLPPTLVLAGANLALSDAPFQGQAVERAVDLAIPVALLVTSPLLVRFVAYYAALAAGRNDIRARDIWRWSRGNGLALALVLLLPLLPALLVLGGLRLLAGEPMLLALGQIGAGPVLFASAAVMAAALARAMGGLLVRPVTEGV